MDFLEGGTSSANLVTLKLLGGYRSTINPTARVPLSGVQTH